MFTVDRADLSDCPLLAETSRAAFEQEASYSRRGRSRPPGYDSPRWHTLAFRWGCVLRIVLNETIIGGAIVIRNGRSALELGRIWLAPDHQGIGLGREALYQLEARSRPDTRWMVDAPVWNHRAIHFYTVCGYREIGRAADAIYYEKIILPTRPSN